MREFQNNVAKWHSKTFKDREDLLSLIMEKLGEEVEELCEAHCADDAKAISEECADVAIALLAYCSRRGIDLESEVARKMTINIARTWKETSKGFERVKPS